MIFTDVYLLSASGDEVMHMNYQNMNGPHILKAFVGLDVDGITSRFYGKDNNGEGFYSMHIGKRDIVLRVVINPDYAASQTVESLRTLVYKAIQSNRMAAMTVRFDNGVEAQASIKGFVTKVEVAHFSNVPELQITLDCSRDPILRAPSITSVDVEGFANPLEPTITDDVSTAPHGFKMQLACVSPMTTFKMEDKAPDIWSEGMPGIASFEVLPGTIDSIVGFQVGDVLFFSSEDLDRHIYITRGGSTIHLAHKIKAGSNWPMIFPGLNEFVITNNWLMINLTYREAHWGV